MCNLDEVYCSEHPPICSTGDINERVDTRGELTSKLTAKTERADTSIRMVQP